MCVFVTAAKPIDLLAKYVNTTEEDMDIEMQEPYFLLKVCIYLIYICICIHVQCGL